MLGRLVLELSRAYGTEDARRIVLHVVRNSLPFDEVARETRLAAQGYTLSVEKTAVLGCFAGTYFMRSKAGRSLTLPIDQTPVDRLEREWRKFRSSALGELRACKPHQPIAAYLRCRLSKGSMGDAGKEPTLAEHIRKKAQRASRNR